MAELELDDIGKKVKILDPVGAHHKNEIGKIDSRDSMPYPGSRRIWFVKAREYVEMYTEEELELV